ncbi:putative phiRv1 phage protein [Mycobacteroides abscessus subsp. abscessus]|nr:putative phiRv1 phage protein [Mycobacteroides abscessus subsp. abscessus]
MNVETRPLAGAGSPASQQVDWWSTYEFVTALAAQANHGPLPTAGTPSWSALPDDDPRKLLALAIAGSHHALRVEVAQTAMAEASHAIAASPNWRTRPRGSAYIPRERAS